MATDIGIGEGDVQLAKVLKLRHVVAIALGFTVSDGILLVLSQVFGLVGPSALLVTILAVLLMASIMFAGAELAGAMPAADFAGEWGNRTMGTYLGFIGTLSYGACAVIAVGLLWFPMGTYLHNFFPSVSVQVIGTVCFLVALVIVYLGALASGESELWLNVALFVVLIAVAIIAFTQFHPSHFQPFFVGGSSGFWQAFPFVVYILFGAETMFAGSEETLPGDKFWPRAIACVLLIIGGSLILSELALTGLLPLKDYTLSEADFATAAKHLFGSFGEDLFNIVAFAAVFHAMLGSLFIGSRFIYKMGQRGYLPKFFTHINKRTLVPDAGLLLTAVFGAIIGSTYYIKTDFYLQAAALLTVAGLFGWVVICLSFISYRLRPELRQQYPSDWHVFPGEGPAGIWIAVVGLITVVMVAGGFIYAGAFQWWFIPLWIAIVTVWYFVARTVNSGDVGWVPGAPMRASASSEEIIR
jgi:APA family basic amino acid/polyamine antiporter